MTSRTRPQKCRSATSCSLSGPTLKLADPIPACTRATNAVSSALTCRLIRQFR